MCFKNRLSVRYGSDSITTGNACPMEFFLDYDEYFQSYVLCGNTDTNNEIMNLKLITNKGRTYEKGVCKDRGFGDDPDKCEHQGVGIIRFFNGTCTSSICDNIVFLNIYYEPF